MRYSFDRSFARSLKRFHPAHQLEIKRRVDLFIRALAAQALPAGFGLTKLRHIANTWRVQGFNAVNLKRGYKVLTVATPQEVIDYVPER